MKNELFEKTPIPKAYMTLAIPIMLSNVLMLVYNMVDMYFIARTKNTDLVAGISLCAPVFTMMVAVGDIYGLGGSSVISRLFGAGNTEDGRRLSVFSLFGGIITGFVIMIVLLVFRTPLLGLLGADEASFQYAEAYLRYIAFGAPFIIFSLVPSNLLRTEGFATAAMTGSIIGSVVNIILDPIFIILLKFGAAGAAIATVIGNICTDIYYVWFITGKSNLLSLNPRGFFITGEELGRILGIGIPSSITNFMQSVAGMLLNNFLVPYGNDKIAAMGIVSKVVMIDVMIMVAFSFGGQPLFGYLYGSRNHKRMKESVRFAYMLVCGTGLLLSLILFIGAPFIIGLFMKDDSIIATGAPMLRAVLCGMPFIGYVMVTTCIFQSTGKATGALILSAGRQGFIYAAVIVLASKLFGYNGVIFAQSVSDLLTALLAFILYQLFLGKELNTDY